jgi:hypothetical protein
MNFSIPAGQTVTFRYRVVVSSGSFPSSDDINKIADEFGLKY